MSLVLKYFVLRPSEKDPHGVASIVAMEKYAAEIKRHDPELSHEIILWVKRVRGEIPAKPRVPLYIKKLRPIRNPRTGAMDLRWQESEDGEKFRPNFGTITEEDLVTKTYPEIPSEVIKLLKHEGVLE